MKKLLYLLIASFALLSSCATTSENTTIEVYNSSDDTIVVYLTIDDNSRMGQPWVSDVNGIFGIVSTNNLQGSFTLVPNEKKSYQSELPIAGNISFNAAPLNCPFPAPTLFEFTLNNQGTVKGAQETIDISCVYGVTSIGSFTMFEGGKWNYGNGDTISYIHNDTLYANTGLPGVYPYGCTTCTGRAGMLDCTNKKPYEDVNSSNICNVQRDSDKNGGYILITYVK